MDPQAEQQTTELEDTNNNNNNHDAEQSHERSTQNNIANSTQHKINKINKTCPSIVKRESCWALSHGKECKYQHPEDNGGNDLPTHVYVAHLPYSFTEANLKELFGVYGEITECKILVDKRTEKSRGAGFVHFRENADAQAAIDDQHDKQIEGAHAPMIVKFALPNSRRGDGKGGKGGKFGKGGGKFGKSGKGWGIPPPYTGADDFHRGYDSPPRGYYRDSYDDRGYDYRPPRGPPRRGPSSRDYYDNYPPRYRGPPPDDYYDDYDDDYGPRRRGPPIRPSPYGPPPGRMGGYQGPPSPRGPRYNGPAIDYDDGPLNGPGSYGPPDDYGPPGPYSDGPGY